MCTITTQTKPIKTIKDIICYKLVDIIDNKIYSAFIRHQYQIGVINNSEITFSDRTEDSFIAFDNIENSHFYVFENTHNILREKYIGKVRSIERGFHSSLTVDRLFADDLNNGESIAECIIPKGSLVYYGKTNLIVSNQIIINKIFNK